MITDSVTARFSDQGQVESVIGALRSDGILAGQITVTAPDGTVSASGHMPHPQGRTSLFTRLRPHHEVVAPAQPAGAHAAEGWLVRVTTRSEAEEQSARNLCIRAGATAISSVTDGTMVPLERPTGL